MKYRVLLTIASLYLLSVSIKLNLNELHAVQETQDEGPQVLQPQILTFEEDGRFGNLLMETAILLLIGM